MRLSVVLFINAPDVPVTDTVTVPAGAVGLAARVSTLLVVAGFGANDAVTPDGSPAAVKVVLPENRFTEFTVIVLVPSLPWITPTVFGEAESVKDWGGGPKQLVRIRTRGKRGRTATVAFLILGALRRSMLGVMVCFGKRSMARDSASLRR